MSDEKTSECNKIDKRKEKKSLIINVANVFSLPLKICSSLNTRRIVIIVRVDSKVS